MIKKKKDKPSLCGAGGLASLIVGVSAFIYFTAWLATLFMQDELEEMPEEEFERIVMRSEELAKQPQRAREATEFELIVANALDQLPPEFQDVLFFFSSRRRHTRWTGDWSSDVCSSD